MVFYLPYVGQHQYHMLIRTKYTTCRANAALTFLFVASDPNIAAITGSPRTARVSGSWCRNAHDDGWILQARASEQGTASREAREAHESNGVDAHASGEGEGDMWNVCNQLEEGG